MSNFHEEHITAYLDGVLDSATAQEVERHLADNRVLDAEYRSLRAVKHLLGERKERLRPQAPPDARHTVLLKLEQEFTRSSTLARIHTTTEFDEQALKPVSSKQGTISIFPLNASIHNTISTSSRRQGASIRALWEHRQLLVAAVVVLALGWTVLRIASGLRSSSENSPEMPQTAYQTLQNGNSVTSVQNCVLVQESLRNYNAVMKGNIKLQYATNSFDTLGAFFRKSGVTCHLVRPRIANATLLGGVVSEENGKKSAHLVFQHNTDLLYMWEIEETPATIRHAAITPEAWKILQTGEWLWSTIPANQATVVFWEDETEKAHRTLCAVVSALPRSKLKPLFQ